MSIVWLVIGLMVGSLVSGVIGLRVVARRVRSAKEAERRARATERLAEIGSLTGGLAHEIKNPLSTVVLNAQLLAEAIGELPIEETERSRLTRRVDSLKRELDRLRGILTDFLEYAGEVRLDRTLVDVNGLVDEMVDFFHPQAVKVGVRLRLELAPGELKAYIDEALIKQAVLNLLLNATQAISSKGQADQGEQGCELIVRSAKGEDANGQPTASIHVIDTGPGMDEKTVKKIFEPYFTTKPGGSGLGLPTARRHIEQHGGHLDVYSEIDRGTDFVITLPVGAES